MQNYSLGVLTSLGRGNMLPRKRGLSFPHVRTTPVVQNELTTLQEQTDGSSMLPQGTLRGLS